jgi:hypothetical protein
LTDARGQVPSPKKEERHEAKEDQADDGFGANPGQEQASDDAHRECDEEASAIDDMAVSTLAG